MEANELKELIFKRTGLTSFELLCPREKSKMTPCVARDGDLAMLEDGTCAGCGKNVKELLRIEMTQEKLYTRYLELINERNETEFSGLSFVFEFEGKFYYVKWNKFQWTDPIPIEVIKEKEGIK